MIDGMDSFVDEIKSELEKELASEIKNDSDRAILSSKIAGAYRAVKRKRNYQSHHTEDFINEDMENLYDIVKELALYDYNMVGAEGETNHSENGISRTWRSRDEILRQVIPFAKVFGSGTC